MRINFKIRWQNPIFWAQVIAAIILPLVVGVGFKWEDMTTWPTLWGAIIDGLKNPVVFVTMIVSLWTAITDPTTSGTSDSSVSLDRENLKKNYKSDPEKEVAK